MKNAYSAPCEKTKRTQSEKQQSMSEKTVLVYREANYKHKLTGNGAFFWGSLGCTTFAMKGVCVMVVVGQ